MQPEDEQAFTAFTVAHGPALVRLARGLLKDPYQAEDVLQDVLAKILLRWDRVSTVSDPPAYARRMVVNACTSWFRRAARREFARDSATLPELPGTQAPDPSRVVDERDRMWALLRQLPAKQRAVLVLRHYEGCSDEEISQLLGTSTVTVRSNAHRGLATLRRWMTAPGTPPASKKGEEVPAP